MKGSQDMRKIDNKKTKVTAATLAMLIGSGVAIAYWTGGGTGSGTATTGTDAALTVTQTSTITGLRPGAAAQELSGKFNNPNAGPVYVNSVIASISGVTKAVGAAAGTCDATDYVLTDATMLVGADVPAGDAKGTWTGAKIQFVNKAGVNQDACKGATVQLAYTIA
jgi:hypothetical protein